MPRGFGHHRPMLRSIRSLLDGTLQPASKAEFMHGEPLTSRTAGRAQLVIVDDHELARAGLRSLLAGERGLEVVGEAANGAEAVALCRQVRPDLVLMDVRMPDVDGLAAARAIKQETPTTSVILFTVYENPDYLVEALKAGAAGYLLKGAAKRQIVTAVRQVLAGESLLNPELVMALLKQLSGVAGDNATAQRLSPRERDVLRLIALGQSNKEIAATLHLTVSTVKTHVEHVIGKLGVSDRTQAAVRAIELGLTSPPAAD
jgi:DNA-binding NarL/FixJ family response regulator